MEKYFDALPKAIPNEVGELAILLHKQRNNTLLSIGHGGRLQSDALQPDCELWAIQGDEIIFSSIEARNQCVALHTFQTSFPVTSEISGAKVFELAHEIWCYENGRNRLACALFLVLSSKHINLLHAAATLIITNPQRVFQVLSLVELAIPHLPELSIEDLCELTIAQHPKTKNDSTNGLFFNAIGASLLQRPQHLAWALYRHVCTNMTEAIGHLYTPALLAIAKSGGAESVIEVILTDAESENIISVHWALWTTARILSEIDLPPKWQIVCKDLIRQKSNAVATPIQHSAVRGLTHAATKHPDLLLDLLTAAKTLDQFILDKVANYLSINLAAVKDHQTFIDFMAILPHLSPKLANGVKGLDYLLANLQEDERFHGMVVDFLTMWVAIHGSPMLREMNFIELFSQIIDKLIAAPDRLKELITEWMISDNVKHAAACGGLISQLWVLNFRKPTFSVKVLDRLNPAEFKFLARRMLGFIYVEEALLSLTFSLLETADAPLRTHALVHSLLCQEIGLDYCDETLAAIKLHLESDQNPHYHVLMSAQATLTAYLKNISDLPKLQELRPLFQLRRSITLKRAREMEKYKDAADEKSIMRQLATKIPLKAGVGCFNIRDGKLGETNHLQLFSEEVRLPSRYLNDPVGHDISGIHFRNAKRGDE